MLYLTTDPTTEAYWVRDLINAERASRSLEEFGCPWVEQASGVPFELGVSDPAQMDVVYADPVGIADPGPSSPGATFLAPNVPNPFRNSTQIRFRMAEPGVAAVAILDAVGRHVRHLGERHHAAGHTQIEWDGRDERGARAPAGVYFVALRTRQGMQRRRIVLIK
jgi:hypothetical protein